MLARTLTQEQPTTSLVRLADVPPSVRLHAYSKLVRRGEITEEEAQLLLETVLEPGDLSALVEGTGELE